MGQSVIQNLEALAITPLRKDALALVDVGYAAIAVGAALERKIRIRSDELRINDAVYNLHGRRIFFVGIGKCAITAAHAIEKIFGDRLTGGIALDVSPGEGAGLKKIEVCIGTHPLPSEANEQATARIIALLTECQENDLVLTLISGGGSTLLCLSNPPMTCLKERELFTKLTAAGAGIQDINTVRKHTSSARGGGLAKAAYPTEVISLIVSDVPGNDIECIASGPTIRDTSTVEDATAVLAHYHIELPEETVFIETPKEQKYFERVTNILFLTNQDALLAMQNEAVRQGYAATVVSNCIHGEAREVGRTIVEALHTAPPKTVLLYAGESTVTRTTGSGVGGRNQEMSLAALPHIRPDELILPFASDGRDNTDHAGAIADATTQAHASDHHLMIKEYLAQHCSYDFFTTTGDALLTGYTGSNVSDLIIAIKN